MQNQPSKPYHRFEVDCSMEDCIKAIEAMKTSPWSGFNSQRVEIRPVSETKVRFTVKQEGNRRRSGHVFGFAERIDDQTSAVYIKSASPMDNIAMAALFGAALIMMYIITVIVMRESSVFVCCGLLSIVSVSSLAYSAALTIDEYRNFFQAFERQLKRKINQ